MPDGKRLQAAEYELSATDMIRAVQLMIETAGIEKLRITGGEPLLSPKFDELLPAVMALPLDDVSVTTNGQLIPRKAKLIIDAGLKRINISLDTLNPDAFRRIARSGDLATVLAGIDQLRSAGIKVKVNMVPMRHVNDDQILPMLAYCLERDIELRFIELMNMGHLRANSTYDNQFYGMDEILAQIATKYEFSRAQAAYDSTAARFAIPDTGFFGIIANESEPFCRTCTRLRISSNGHLFGCLSNSRSYDLKPVLDLPDELAMSKLQSVLVSALGDKQNLSFTGEVTVMKFIGG